MIAGILDKNPHHKIAAEEIYSMFPFGEQEKNSVAISQQNNFALGLCPAKLKLNDFKAELWQENKKVAGFLGSVFNKSELGIKSTSKENLAKDLFDLYKTKKEKLFDEINGSYNLAIWDGESRQFVLSRDHLGIEPLYYFWDEKKLIFASSIKMLLRHSEVKAEIDFDSLNTYLLFNYNPRPQSVIAKVKKLRAGFYLKFTSGHLKAERYWYLSFKMGEETTEHQVVEALLPLMKKSINIRLSNTDRQGAFLSGGMDSSSVVGLMSSMVQEKIHTFSFRCQGKSFDESHYANIVSCRYNTEHHLVEFSPQEILSIGEIVASMDEPFCDIGIEVASYLLGRAAQDKVDYVLTGDGGDELFAGHPVYQADGVAKKFSRMPRPLQKMITSVFSLFPDTDKKKSFAVKAQRFAYSFGFPEELFSNRWRIYYQQSELMKLFQPEFYNQHQKANPLDDIISVYNEADGENFLSKTLYGDYFTVVNFYLRRMQLLRSFNIQGRFPMLDPRLIEFAAKIPASLKLRGAATKYILHKTMTGILPDEIVFRKDKLGHSVPFKNWLREVPEIKTFISDTLSESTIKKRGYFNYNFVQKLLNEHFKRKKNNSHRIWALLVLELWMQKNIDF